VEGACSAEAPIIIQSRRGSSRSLSPPKAARVETVAPGMASQRRYYEYDLVLCEGSPRLTRVALYLDPTGKPLVPPEKAAHMLSAPSLDAPLGAVPHGVEPNGDRIFEAPRTVTAFEAPHTLEVRRLGELAVTSG
jgi:hypothetical protein